MSAYSLLESYLSERSRWKDEVASGAVGPKSIKRLKEAGVGKTEKEFVKGLEKGTSNILKQHNTKDL
jgi:hypothetical protein